MAFRVLPRISQLTPGAAVTSDAGLVAYRKLDETPGPTAMADDMFRDPRHGKNTQHELVDLLRQSVYSRLAGYEDTNDAQRLAIDPAMRQVVAPTQRNQAHKSPWRTWDGPFHRPGPENLKNGVGATRKGAVH
jgi:hypothetical protein